MRWKLNIWGPAACGLCAALAILPPTVAGAVHAPESIESADGTIERLVDENAQLRQRLVSARRDLYNALPAASRAAELQALLTDSLSDLKLLGIALAESFVTTQATIPDELTQAMGDTVQPTGLQAWVARQDLEQAASSRVLGIDGLDILAQQSTPTTQAARVDLWAGGRSIPIYFFRTLLDCHMSVYQIPLPSLVQISQCDRVQRLDQPVTNLFPDALGAAAGLR
jgi:hypothetical protein